MSRRTPREAIRFTDSRRLPTLSRQTTIETLVGMPRSRHRLRASTTIFSAPDTPRIQS